MKHAWLLIAAVLLAACEQVRTPLYLPSSEDYPQKLSAWGVLQQQGGYLQPATGVLP